MKASQAENWTVSIPGKPIITALFVVNALLFVALILAALTPSYPPPVWLQLKKVAEVYDGTFHTRYCLDSKVVINTDFIHFTDFARSKYKKALEKNEIKDLRIVLKLGNDKILPEKFSVVGKPYTNKHNLIIELPHQCLTKPVKEGVFLIYSGKHLIGKVPVGVAVANK